MSQKTGLKVRLQCIETLQKTQEQQASVSMLKFTAVQLDKDKACVAFWEGFQEKAPCL